MIGDPEERSEGPWFRRGLNEGARFGREGFDGSGGLRLTSDFGEAMPKPGGCCCGGGMKGDGSSRLD